MKKRILRYYLFHNGKKVVRDYLVLGKDVLLYNGKQVLNLDNKEDRTFVEQFVRVQEGHLRNAVKELSEQIKEMQEELKGYERVKKLLGSSVPPTETQPTLEYVI